MQLLQVLWSSILPWKCLVPQKSSFIWENFIDFISLILGFLQSFIYSQMIMSTMLTQDNLSVMISTQIWILKRDISHLWQCCIGEWNYPFFSLDSVIIITSYYRCQINFIVFITAFTLCLWNSSLSARLRKNSDVYTAVSMMKQLILLSPLPWYSDINCSVVMVSYSMASATTLGETDYAITPLPFPCSQVRILLLEFLQSWSNIPYF